MPVCLDQGDVDDDSWYENSVYQIIDPRRCAGLLDSLGENACLCLLELAWISWARTGLRTLGPLILKRPYVVALSTRAQLVKQGPCRPRVMLPHALTMLFLKFELDFTFAQ